MVDNHFCEICHDNNSHISRATLLRCQHHCSFISELWSASPMFAPSVLTFKVCDSIFNTCLLSFGAACISSSRFVQTDGASHMTELVSYIIWHLSTNACDGSVSPCIRKPEMVALTFAYLACFSANGSFLIPSLVSLETVVFRCDKTNVAASKCSLLSRPICPAEAPASQYRI